MVGTVRLAWASSEIQDVVPLLCACLAALAFGILWATLAERKRTREIREFAHKWHLGYLGARMPATFRLDRGKAFESVASVRRALVGTAGEKELVLLDCRVRGGRKRRWRTIIAARGLRDGFGWAQYGPDLKTEKRGEWAIVYSETQFIPVGDLDTLMEKFSGRDQGIGRNATGG